MDEQAEIRQIESKTHDSLDQYLKETVIANHRSHAQINQSIRESIAEYYIVPIENVQIATQQIGSTVLLTMMKVNW